MCDDKDAVVLVIDDSEDNLFLMELLLADNGYKVEKARCGKEGIAKIRQLIPDLIILDLMMPDMTGCEVINAIKVNEILSQIPIILCTANALIDKNDVIGIEDICYKPFDIIDMLNRVKSLVACCEANRSSTIVLDPNDTDPLCVEHQQLLSAFRDPLFSLDVLQKQGYKVFQ